MVQKNREFRFAVKNKTKNKTAGKTTTPPLRGLRATCYSLLCLGVSIAGSSQPAQAENELVITAGVQEMYDDNIYLEDDGGVKLEQLNLDPNQSADFVNSLPEQLNGKPNDDLITNLFFGVSGAVPLSSHLKTGAEAKLGALIFSDYSDESRLTLDASFATSAERSLLAEPFYADAKVALQSRANDISSASGTASEQAETLFTGFNLGARKIKIAPQTDFGLGYSFGYNDFLGDWLFSNNRDELGVYQNLLEPKGSDYITNAVETGVDYNFSEQFAAGVFANLTDYYFTSVDSLDLEQREKDDLNRDDAVIGLRSSYQPSKQVKAGAMAGVLISHLQNKPQDILVEVPGTQGEPIQVSRDGSQDDTSLVFNADLSYTPDEASQIRFSVNQVRQTDLDGQRLLTRGVNLEATRAIGERLKVVLSGKFLQYESGDSLSNPTDRFEVVTGLQYAITESLALGAGWNYSTQNADDSLQNRLDFENQDYEVNRFYIGLTGGLVGKKS